MPLGVAIIDDDRLIRKGLEALLNGTPGMRCVAAYADGETALKLLPRVSPDVALVDIQLPGLSGVDCVARLKRACPKTQFLMLTVMADEDEVFHSLRNGAVGYLLKGTPAAAIVQAIQEVHAGGSPMTGTIARQMVGYFQRQSPAADETTGLTARERELLEFFVRGMRPAEVAAQAGVSLATVRTHLRNLYDKLQVHSRAELVARALGRNPRLPHL